MNPAIDSEIYCCRSRQPNTSKTFDKSIVFCKRALTTKPRHCDGHFKWGLNLLKQGTYNKAEKKYKEVVLRDPMDSISHYNLGLAFENQNKLSEAEAEYKRSLEINSSLREPFHNLAIVLTKRAKYTEALEQYEKNIYNYEGDSSTDNCYGYLKFVLGRYEEAIKSFEDAIREDPEYSLPYLNKSLALYCLGKHELAVGVFKGGVWKVSNGENWQKRLEGDLRIYEEELRRFEEILEKDELSEINKEQLEVNIRGLRWIVDLLKQEIASKSLLESNAEG